MIPEIAELTVFYMNLVSLNRVLRNPTVKEEVKQKGMKENLSVGFAMYPVSQAADITAFGADLVPVGDDQLPMVELTREIVKRFNNVYGEVLTVPEALVGECPRLVGLDGKTKMGKSLNNGIYLSDTKEEVEKKVMGMYTDPDRLKASDPGKVEGNPVFIYHDVFNKDKKEVEDLKKRYREGKVGDVEVKQKLIRVINEVLDPMRERREELEKNPDKVEEILKDGVEKGRVVTKEILKKVKKAMKIDYQFGGK